MITEQLRELIVIPEREIYPRVGEHESHYAVDRMTLRRILLAGLDDVVHFDSEVVGYELTSDCTVAVLADGRRVAGDLLVAADGVHSKLARQYLPDAPRHPVDDVGVAQKLPLTSDTLA